MSDDNKEGAGVPVLTMYRGGTAAFGRANVVVRWEAGAENLPDGEHKLYATPRAVMPAAPSDAVTDAIQSAENILDRVALSVGTSTTAEKEREWRDAARIAIGGIRWEISRDALSQTMQPQAEPPYITAMIDARRQRYALDQSCTPAFLHWLDTIAPREGVAANEAWNAGVEWQKRQPQAEPAAGEQAGAVALSDEQIDQACERHSIALRAGLTSRNAMKRAIESFLAAPGAAIAAREQEALRALHGDQARIESQWIKFVEESGVAPTGVMAASFILCSLRLLGDERAAHESRKEPSAASEQWTPLAPEQHSEALAAGDLMAVAEEVGGARMAENVVQVTRSDIERIMEFVQRDNASREESAASSSMDAEAPQQAVSEADDKRNARGSPFSADDLRMPLPPLPEPFIASTDVGYALHRAPEVLRFGAACYRKALAAVSQQAVSDSQLENVIQIVRNIFGGHSGCSNSAEWGYMSALARKSIREALSTLTIDAMDLTAAARDVLAERQRQISAEGWTPAHDDEHETGELASAAAAYAEASPMIGEAGAEFGIGDPPEVWPWEIEHWKPGDQRRMLVKAGALLLAEIERLDRATPPVAGAQE